LHRDFGLGWHQAEAMELEEAGVRRGGRRQRFSVEQKRQIVEATLVP
jgi:hypothetical protein